jgi:hypothetical protein
MLNPGEHISGDGISAKLPLGKACRFPRNAYFLTQFHYAPPSFTQFCYQYITQSWDVKLCRIRKNGCFSIFLLVTKNSFAIFPFLVYNNTNHEMKGGASWIPTTAAR